MHRPTGWKDVLPRPPRSARSTTFTSKDADADGGGTRFVGESRSAGECATLDIDGAATNATWKGREPTMIAPRGGSRLRIEAA